MCAGKLRGSTRRIKRDPWLCSKRKKPQIDHGSPIRQGWPNRMVCWRTIRETKEEHARLCDWRWFWCNRLPAIDENLVMWMTNY
jgi:hypothetical protein